MKFGTQWVEQKYLAGTLIEVDDLVNVVDSLIRQGSVCIPSLTLAPRGAPAGDEHTGALRR